MKNQNIAISVVAVIVLLAVGYYFFGSSLTDTDMGDAGDNMPVVSDYVDVNPKEAKELIENTPDLVIIDVSPDYDKGHLPGAINYYLGDGSLDAAIPNLDKSVTYLVYCHYDGPSIQGAQKLVDAGFPSVYRLDGNYAGWVAFGYDVEK